MVNMGVFGAMGAVLGVGARIADERDAGWNRQLRLTPLPPLGYVAGKVLTGMLVALPALVLVCLAGRLTGEVHLAPPSGPRSLGLGWLAVLPMAVVGVGARLPRPGRQRAGGQRRPGHAAVDVRRHLVPDRRTSPTWLQSTAHVMPTYWITQITRAPLTHAWPAVGGWAVLAAWVGGRRPARRAALPRATTCGAA